MAGTALSAGVLVVAASFSLGLAGVGGAVVVAQRTASAADAAALAAADAASGAIVTDEAPCALGARVAAASGATLVSCTLEGQVATVRVQSVYAGVAAVSRARAGPPEGF